MKSKRLAAMFMLCLVAIFSVVVAKGEETAVQVNIPFDFSAGGSHLSAGEYAVTRLSVTTNGTLSIKSEHQGAMVLSNLSGERRSDGTCLIFNRYGDKYFLAAVWIAESGTGYQVPKSKMEREMIARGASPTVELLAANTR